MKRIATNVQLHVNCAVFCAVGRLAPLARKSEHSAMFSELMRHEWLGCHHYREPRLLHGHHPPHGHPQRLNILAEPFACTTKLQRRKLFIELYSILVHPNEDHKGLASWRVWALVSNHYQCLCTFESLQKTFLAVGSTLVRPRVALALYSAVATCMTRLNSLVCFQGMRQKKAQAAFKGL